MTSFESSSKKISSGRGEDDLLCPECGGPMAWRQEHPYPIGLQAGFGLSFLAFLFAFDHVRANRPVVWAWSLVQIALGILLIRGRRRAGKRVLRCIRCTGALR